MKLEPVKITRKTFYILESLFSCLAAVMAFYVFYKLPIIEAADLVVCFTLIGIAAGWRGYGMGFVHATEIAEDKENGA